MHAGHYKNLIYGYNMHIQQKSSTMVIGEYYYPDHWSLLPMNREMSPKLENKRRGGFYVRSSRDN